MKSFFAALPALPQMAAEQLALKSAGAARSSADLSGRPSIISTSNTSGPIRKSPGKVLSWSYRRPPIGLIFGWGFISVVERKLKLNAAMRCGV